MLKGKMFVSKYHFYSNIVVLSCSGLHIIFYRLKRYEMVQIPAEIKIYNHFKMQFYGNENNDVISSFPL